MSLETEVDNCPERMQAAVDNCPERMQAADAEAPRPPRIETAVEFWSGMGVETATRMVEVAARMQTAVEVLLGVQSMTGSMGALLVMRRCFCCTREKKRNKKKKQELKAAGEC